jgi:class 3 adenylate cyclase/alpha-beta hydrolase superfamily lysophospholipase
MSSAMADVPVTQYARLGDDRIAYQVFGEGDVDLLWVPSSGDCIDLRWDWPPYAGFLQRLGGRTRVISFDRRGTGASDAPSGEILPSWELWADDARAVLDAVGAERAVICGNADAGPTAILFGAIHPSRTSGLVLMDTCARFGAAADYPAGRSADDLADISQLVADIWGTEAMGPFTAPELARRDPAFSKWFAKSERLYMSPRDAARLLEIEQVWDVREALPLIAVPTLVLHVEEFAPIPIEHGRYLAEKIAGARLAVLSGTDAFPFGEVDEGERYLEEFLGGLAAVSVPERALSTILFTDFVGSTAQASELGDRAWRNLLDTHDALARTVVEQHRGRLIHASGAMGDGILATFDGPGRAIRCAQALNDALRPLGISIRAGLHTGEIDYRDSGIAGIGVHIAARVMDAASSGDLLVSPAVPLLVAGSGFEFEDRGEHELKGVPGTWRLYAVSG